jgi:hypothetical protein
MTVAAGLAPDRRYADIIPPAQPSPVAASDLSQPQQGRILPASPRTQPQWQQLKKLPDP